MLLPHLERRVRMTDPHEETQQLRADAARAEREAILEIIERSARRLSHGHGATGTQVLQEIVAEIEARGGDVGA
jgi:hypothetical protein